MPDFLMQKIPVGKWAKVFIDYLTDNFYEEFRFFSDGLDWLINGLILLLGAIPPVFLILIFCALGYWLHRNWKLVVGIGIALLIIVNLGYWDRTIETVALVIYSTLISCFIGVPLGIAAAHRR